LADLDAKPFAPSSPQIAMTESEVLASAWSSPEDMVLANTFTLKMGLSNSRLSKLAVSLP